MSRLFFHKKLKNGNRVFLQRDKKGDYRLMFDRKLDFYDKCRGAPKGSVVRNGRVITKLALSKDAMEALLNLSMPLSYWYEVKENEPTR